MATAEQAVELLLHILRTSVDYPLRPEPGALVDLGAARPVLRRFKLDVSFALHRDGARFSINDKGEELAFRARMTSHAEALGGTTELLERFFSLSEPGAVQTTVGVKWATPGERANRVSLYYEELTRCPAGPALMHAVTEAFEGARAAPPPSLSPAAICVDIENGRPVAIKDYWMALERSDEPAVTLPPSLDAFRRSFPLDPERGTRRYLLARRFHLDGELVGHKLLWQSEAHTFAAAERAWIHVDRLSASLAASRNVAALGKLRSRWSLADYYFYPDLVCLDIQANGDPAGLIVYVSIK